jgi:hypothetical protein
MPVPHLFANVTEDATAKIDANFAACALKSEFPSVKDYGAVGNGSTNDTAARTASFAAVGYAWYPSSASTYPVTTWTGLSGATGTVNISANTIEADEGFVGQGTLRVRRNTSTTKDAIYAEHYGSGTGYAVHGISYAANGSGIGGACWGVGAGVLGNKRGTTAGNGIAGFAGIDNGNDQTGAVGTYSGSGTGGTGVAAVNSGTNVAGGNALFCWRSGAGGGSSSQHLRDGGGDGTAITATRAGSGAGDGASVECSTTAGGNAVTAVRRVGATTYAIGYLGYYDVGANESVGVYGTAITGTIQWAGRFDGSTTTSGFGRFGGGVRPTVDNGANCGEAALRWSAVYANNGTIQTSDANAKQDIRELTDAETRVAAKLKKSIRAFRYKDAAQTKGDAARVHVGTIAQDVAQAFASEGLDASRYGVFCSDTFSNESGAETTRLSVRYDELFAFIVAAL